MTGFLFLILSIIVSTDARLSYCEAFAQIGEVTALYECPPGYVATSIGMCCDEKNVLYTICADKVNSEGVNECTELTDYCNHSLFKNTMIANCAKTCGFCT
ncbi:hypothetical protein CRE_06441 [Caenorhabditis remanei]|uniref:Uncharacterized protein n=1 Tax=Caenorhabditis remanei TaxID=31234 RepID=E3M0Y3_CAERE|nr:hypothetical protein CRE_06441 [Caenorhabditis remanei]